MHRRGQAGSLSAVGSAPKQKACGRVHGRRACEAPGRPPYLSLGRGGRCRCLLGLRRRRVDRAPGRRRAPVVEAGAGYDAEVAGGSAGVGGPAGQSAANWARAESGAADTQG